MKNLLKPKLLKTVGLGIAGFSLIISSLGILFVVFSSFGDLIDAGFIVLNAFVYSLIAALIILKQPKHIIGWLFLLVGFFSAVMTLFGSLETILTLDSSDLIVFLMGWISFILFLPALMIPLTLVLQFFPDGHLPSRRWWPIPAISLFGIFGFVISVGFLPGSFEANGIPGPNNRFGIPGSERYMMFLGDVAQVAFAIGLIGALVILIVRFRGAGPVQRNQMKWLFFTALIGITILLLPSQILRLINVNQSGIEEKVFVFLPSLMAVVIGMAILRYRLFDIDIIIRKTLQYGIVTVILALVYFGLVILFQTLFSSLGDQQSDLYIVASTLLIIALFNPIRRRVQNAVDRRFYRGKYQAQVALTQFAAAARDEVDMDRLVSTLMQVIDETVKPEHASFLVIKELRSKGRN